MMLIEYCWKASSMGSLPLALVIVQREGFGALFRWGEVNCPTQIICIWMFIPTDKYKRALFRWEAST